VERARDSRARPRPKRRARELTDSPFVIANSWRCSLSVRGIPESWREIAATLAPAPARLGDDRRQKSKSEQQGGGERHQCDVNLVAKADRR